MMLSIVQGDTFVGMLDLSLLRRLLVLPKCKCNADWLEVLAFSKYEKCNNKSSIRA